MTAEFRLIAEARPGPDPDHQEVNACTGTADDQQRQFHLETVSCFGQLLQQLPRRQVETVPGNAVAPSAGCKTLKPSV